MQADLKVFTLLGVYGTTALTVITAQNTRQVAQVMEIPSPMIQKQIELIVQDIPPQATKTGMLSSISMIEAVADSIRREHLLPYICDPVMVSKAGSPLIQPDAIAAIIQHLLPLATIATPNRREAAMLTGIAPEQLTTVADAREAAKKILQMGAQAVVVKKILVGQESIDVLTDGQSFYELAGPALPDKQAAIHGSGCALSAAITAFLAQDIALLPAVEQAKQFVARGITTSAGLGHGVEPVNVLVHR